jgi:GMP synthase (glutamine-hydrolysing)
LTGPRLASVDGEDRSGPVLVVDFGAQYAQLIARRVREARVYSEIVPHTMPVTEMLAKRPAAIILSGGPASVYAEGATSVDPSLFQGGVPTLGICYGFQAMALGLGGEVARTGLAEFGGTALTVVDEGALFRGLPAEQSVWMSHGDSVSAAPEGFVVTAVSDGAPIAAFEDLSRGFAGV